MRRWLIVVAALGLVAEPASAQDKPAAPAPAPAPAAAPAPAPAATGAAPTPAAQPTSAASEPGAAAPAPGAYKTGAAAEADKKPATPSVTGGYSWTDKPAKKGTQRRWRAKKIDPNAPIATYPGFRMNSDGTSQVWVQVNRKVTVNSGGGSGLYTYVLTGAQIPTWNNTNPLVTEYFDTPLARARLKNDKNGAQLVLEMREGVQPKHRVVDGPNGTLMLYIDLPKASRTYSARNEDVSQVGRRNGRVLPGRRGSTTVGASRAAPSRGPNP